MEHFAEADSSSDEIDLTLTDEDIDVSPGPKSRISEHKRVEIRNICKSGFGSEFMRDHAESEYANFSRLLDMLQSNQFASVDEVKREAQNFLDAQLCWFQDPTHQPKSGTIFQKSEMILMAENLKQRFKDLVDLEGSAHCQSTEYKIVERLSEIFPHLDNIELHLKANHYLDKRLRKMKSSGEKDIDVALAVNGISEAIFNEETDSDGFPKLGQNRWVFTFYFGFPYS